MVRTRQSLSKYTDRLLSEGRSVFTATEAENDLGVGHRSFLDAAERLQRSQKLLTPRQGFYVVVPPQYAGWGGPPPTWFIDALMRREGAAYYVGLLKAAEFHGATHQAVMQFQVVCGKRLRDIRAGRSVIVFYFRRKMGNPLAGVEDRKTDTGTMKMSSAALTALDLIRYPQASGGIDNVATVLADLAPTIDADALASLSTQVEQSVVQRLGHLLDRVGEDRLTGPMLDGLRSRADPALDRTRPGQLLPGLRARPAGARRQMAYPRASRAGARSVIPSQNVVAWASVVPWVEPRQVEQDLVISRALVEMFEDRLLREALRFRGGTALHKLHFPNPLRYSEDIDLVRTSKGPIGSIVDRLRAVLEPWLGEARFAQSPVAPKLRFRTESEDVSGVPIRVKIEINTREIQAFDPPVSKRLGVENPWFTGEAYIPTFSSEEMLATKLRALLQRNKGRDLYDLAYGLATLEPLDIDRIVELFGCYMESSGTSISRAQAQERMFAKLANPRLWLDVRPLLPADRTVTPTIAAQSYQRVFVDLVDKLPGEPWARTEAMKARFGIEW